MTLSVAALFVVCARVDEFEYAAFRSHSGRDQSPFEARNKSAERLGGHAPDPLGFECGRNGCGV
jgi:hypothetical protein